MLWHAIRAVCVPPVETVFAVLAPGDRIFGEEDWGAFRGKLGPLMHALQHARGLVTDEASAIEQLGLKPRLVAGSRENLKVTWPEDLAMAEAILRRRQ